MVTASPHESRLGAPAGRWLERDRPKASGCGEPERSVSKPELSLAKRNLLVFSIDILLLK